MKFTYILSIYCMLMFSQLTLKAQTLKTPTPSPMQTIKQSFALTDIGIEYYRPSAKGRTVFGDLVPFGKIWRTGANGATKLTFGEDVTIEGNKVPAGTYALYTIPNKDKWEILFYKDLKLGGNVNDYNKENELFRISSNVVKMSDKVETFTINVSDINPSNCKIEITWENTKVSFSVNADIDAVVMKNIDNLMEKDSRPYYQAASYYFENNKDLKKALEWINKAVEQNPKAYWVALLKAKIELKSGDKKAAAITAQKVIEIAKESKNDDYVKMAEGIISETKK
jgi:tetratricopeptide (TPR) repeat protein